MDSSFDVANDSEDDFDWEEVAVPTEGQATPDPSSSAAPEPVYVDVEEGPSNAVRPNIEITLHAKPKADDSAKCVFHIWLRARRVDMFPLGKRLPLYRLHESPELLAIRCIPSYCWGMQWYETNGSMMIYLKYVRRGLDCER